ncbi:PPOX class F420-dependent oxidoreductase [Saccharopolyspora hirsuta]|uniref:PPOX class F420-dependent oxidoreductase n=1 Tax=Saccharopolyspora hirsuta TaxID=1837 RepID=A0A5M7BFU2_SACHI|nr:PPOX class F420-dependent oxidoreductase [Saccharopolyspora hirsuta]KAA5826095.1 PPOX class F420-dependent oxidoreductase [Saccharopolyspora hirsuta]
MTSGVSPARLAELLDSRVFGIVATVQPDGSPQQTVVWVAREGEDVLFMCAIGSRKERNLRRDPRVTVLVTPAEAPHTYAAVHGTATFEPERAEQLREQLVRKYIGKSWAQHIADTPEAGADRRPITAVRISPRKVVGRL